jgi:hypothetical protein
MREVHGASQRSANYSQKSARIAISRALSERNVNGGRASVQLLKGQALRFVSEGARELQRRAVRRAARRELPRVADAQRDVLLLHKPVPNHRLRASIAHLIDAGDKAVA